MPLVHQKNFAFTASMFVATALHAALLGSVVFTFSSIQTQSRPPYFSFLGSILTDKDVILDPTLSSTPATPQPQRANIELNYGQTTILTETLQPIKPRARVKNEASQKIFIKSTFLPEHPEKAPQANTEDFQLKEPLHIPLTLEPHDKN